MRQMQKIWKFSTANFTLDLSWDYEQDGDLSWDETGEVQEKIASGEWINVIFRVRLLDSLGNELASDYLGDCIYNSPLDFREPGYFYDMARNCLKRGREAIHKQAAIAAQLRY